MKFIDRIKLPYREDYVFGFLFLAILIVPLIFSLHSYEDFETIKLCFLAVFTGLAGLIFFRAQLKGGQSKYLFPRQAKGAFLFLATFIFWTLLVSLFAVDKNFAFLGFYSRFNSSFILFVLLGLIFFLILSLRKEQIIYLLRVAFFCSFLVGLWGILGSFGIGYYNGLTTDVLLHGVPSFLGNPNFSSMFVAVFIPVGLSFLFIEQKKDRKVYYTLALLVQLYSMLIFASRGAFAGLIISFLVTPLLSVFLFKGRQKKFVLFFLTAIVFLCVFGAVVLGYTRPALLRNGLSSSESNIQLRLDVWNIGIKAIMEKPLLGYGPGNFEIIFERNRALSSSKRNFFDDPHNLYIYLATAGGLPLVGLLLFAIAAALYKTVKRFALLIQADQILSLGVIGGLSSWMVAVCFNPLTAPCYLALILFLAFLVSLDDEPVSIGTRSFFYFGLIVSCLFIIVGCSYFIAENLFFSSIQDYNQGNFVSANRLAKMAIIFNPTNNLYYEYETASAIGSNKPKAEVQADIDRFSKFHLNRAYTYVEIANLNYLAAYHLQDQQFKNQILTNINKGIELDPQAETYYVAKAQYLLVFGQPDQAKLVLYKALAIDPTDSDAVMFLAKIYQLENNRTGMKNALKMSLNLRPDFLLTQQLLHSLEQNEPLSNLAFKIYLSVGRLD